MVALPSTLDLEVAVSWDGSGAFDGDYDDVTADVAIDPGVRIDEGRDGAQTLAPPKIQAGAFDLWNDDGAYSQERADSPVYQRVIPGRPVRYQARFGVEGLYDEDDPYDADDLYDGIGVFPLGRHLIDDISQQTEIGDRRVSFATLGYEAVLTAAAVSIGVMTTPLVSECFAALLDAVAWPAEKRDIAVSDTRLLLWWCDERVPWVAMLELLAAEGPGTFYVDRDGVFHFENRNYRTIADRSTTSQAVFYDRESGIEDPYDADDFYPGDDNYPGATSGLWFTGFRYDPGFKNVFNRATYTTRQRLAGPTATVWTYGGRLDLGSGQTRTLIARPSDPFINASVPTYSVSGGTVSVSMSATSGLVAFITFTATSGTPEISNLQLEAQPLAVVGDTTVQNTVDASASIARFSPIPGQAIPITLAVQGWPEIDQPNAEAVCDAWVNRYSVQRPQVTIAVRNADGEHLDQILRRMPSDRITLVEANTGIEADVWVNAVALRIAGAGSTTIEAVLGCEKVEEVSGAIWDVSEWDDPISVWGV